MKWNKTIWLILLVAALLSGCGNSNPVLLSLPDYQHKAFYTEGEFQDYTDYGTYTYPDFDETILMQNPYFQKVTNAEDILPYIENFEGWVDLCPEDSELAVNYDFDAGCIDEQDYAYIDSKEGDPIGSGTYRKFDNYDVYFFDTDTWTLYYFHSNI